MALKMTKQRQLLLSFLQKQKTPLSAEMIYAKLPSGSMNLSTIYRTLDTFANYKMVDKTYLDNTTYFKINTLEHKHYLVCLSCHKMYEMDCHIDHIANETADKFHFQITHHDLTVYGFCQTCQEANLNH